MRLILKLLALAGYLYLLWMATVSDGQFVALWTLGIFGAIGLVSLFKVAYPSEEGLSLMGVVTFIFLVGPVAISVILPAELYDLGFSSKPATMTWPMTGGALLDSLLFIVMLWIPAFLYKLIDTFPWWRRRRSA